MTEELQKKHRVIGIRHTLKAFKKEGLVEEDAVYPDEGVEDVQEQIAAAAVRWYKIGARRGAKVLVKAILDRKVRIQTGGRRPVLETSLDAIQWPKKRIRVRVGHQTIRRKLDGFELRLIEDLEFKEGN